MSEPNLDVLREMQQRGQATTAAEVDHQRALIAVLVDLVSRCAQHDTQIAELRDRVTALETRRGRRGR